MKINSKLIIVSILGLIIALFPMPYGYYQLLRLLVSIATGITVYNLSKSNDKSAWLPIFIIILLLFNPIIPVHLTREIWAVLNIITATLLIFSFFYIKKLAEPQNADY